MPTNSRIMRRRQVCLFGTSANPPTGDGGHRGIVRALCQLGRFDEVRVLPVYQHPFSSKRNVLVSYEHRMNMCRLAFEGITPVHVSNAEERLFQRLVQSNMSKDEVQSIRVGTADLLEMLMSEEPETDFSFCFGADTFMDLTAWKWRRSKDVLDLLEGRLVVLHRKGMTNDDLHGRVDQVNKGEGRGQTVLLHVPSLLDVSSSRVRSTTDEENLSTMLSPEVLEYIKKNKLYAFADAGCDDVCNPSS